MENEKEQFVTVPNSLVECENISPKSLVIYCALKRYMNKDTKECYPKISTIAQDVGCGKDAILKALKELEDSGFISIQKRKGQSNVYKFSEHKNFEPFSYDFLDNPNIKLREKAYLVAQQKNMFVKEQTGIGITAMSTKEIASVIHMSVPTVLSCENKLIQQGYLTKPNSKLIDTETNLHEKLRLYLLQLYNMAALTYRQTQKNTEDIELLKAQNVELMKEIELLKRQVFKNTIPEIILK